jgi:hypothetical protein
MSDEEWHENSIAVMALAGALVRADHFDTAEDLLYFLEKPWKYTPEHELWVDCGRPDLDEDGWPEFLRKLEKLAGL